MGFDKIFCNLRVRDALSRISEGDMSGLTALYNCLGRQIYALVFSIVKEPHDAEDAMQETFAKITEKIETYRKDGNGRAWVMAIARNIAIDAVRRRKQTVPLESVDYVASEGDFTAISEVNELLQKLDETDRDIIILKIVNGFKFREISEIVGLTKAATEKRYHRALSKLKKLYTEEK